MANVTKAAFVTAMLCGVVTAAAVDAVDDPGDSAILTSDNGDLVMAVHSPRPVLRAAMALEKRYGYVITYEDPQYTNADDLTDVAASVRKDYSKFASGAAPKLMVPKTGDLTLHLSASSSISSGDLSALLTELVRGQQSRGRGGHFRVDQDGDAFHIVPTEVRDRTGNWSPHSSLLDTPISLPVQQRTERELYRAIAAQISSTAHVSMDVAVNGGFAMGFARPEPVTNIGATTEPARRVLMRALQIHPTKRTWALLHAPESGYNQFSLNILDIPAPATTDTAP